MTSATFDTLKFANALKAVGVPDKQAEAEAQVLSEVFSINFREVATKEDLKRLVADLDGKFRELEHRITAKIDQNKTELTAKIEQNKSDLTAKIDQNKTELTAKIEQTKSDLTAKIEQLRLELTGKIELLNSKIDMIYTKLSGDMLLIRWMFGLLISFAVAMTIRLFLFPKP